MLDRRNNIAADIRNSEARYRTPAATPGKAIQKGASRVVGYSIRAMAPAQTETTGHAANQKIAR
jgi:hypothetical protein